MSPQLRQESLERWSLLTLARFAAENVEALAGSGPLAEDRRAALLQLVEHLERKALAVSPPAASESAP
jgi:hypothetical protein